MRTLGASFRLRCGCDRRPDRTIRRRVRSPDHEPLGRRHSSPSPESPHLQKPRHLCRACDRAGQNRGFLHPLRCLRHYRRRLTGSIGGRGDFGDIITVSRGIIQCEEEQVGFSRPASLFYLHSTSPHPHSPPEHQFYSDGDRTIPGRVRLQFADLARFHPCRVWLSSANIGARVCRPLRSLTRTMKMKLRMLPTLIPPSLGPHARRSLPCSWATRPARSFLVLRDMARPPSLEAAHAFEIIFGTASDRVISRALRDGQEDRYRASTRSL